MLLLNLCIRKNKMERISVILPICNRYETAIENIKNIKNQENQDFEIIVCDDSHKDYIASNFFMLDCVLNDIRYYQVSLYDINNEKTYGIARARNKGVVEATGEILVFLDERMTPKFPNFLDIFKNIAKEKAWYYGNTGEFETLFVENCSCIRRQHLIDAGMFCEHINQWGGMTYEILHRFKSQGFKFIYVKEALAKPLRERSENEMKGKTKSAFEIKRILLDKISVPTPGLVCYSNFLHV
jgi:hypothetical protein